MHSFAPSLQLSYNTVLHIPSAADPCWVCAYAVRALAPPPHLHTRRRRCMPAMTRSRDCWRTCSLQRPHARYVGAVRDSEHPSVARQGAAGQQQPQQRCSRGPARFHGSTFLTSVAVPGGGPQRETQEATRPTRDARPAPRKALAGFKATCRSASELAKLRWTSSTGRPQALLAICYCESVGPYHTTSSACSVCVCHRCLPTRL